MNQHFLLIGAMKAGTSSLHHDLSLLDGVYMTPEKEPNDLICDSVLTVDGEARYLRKFNGAAKGDICGEASTAYSQMPTHPGVPYRARQVLGETLRIIYMTRDPVDRIVSQYQHLRALGFETRPLNQAVLEDSTYVGYSAYQYQLEFWLNAFPKEQILTVKFEDYIDDPKTVLQTIAMFLEVTPPSSVSKTHRNSSAAKFYMPRGSFLHRLTSSRFIQYTIKPLLGRSLIDALRRLFLPKAVSTGEQLTPETNQELKDRLSVLESS